MHIGHKIQELADASGMSIKDFAKSINRSREYAYAIFKKENIDTGLLITIAKVLSVPVYVFFDDPIPQNYPAQDSAENAPTVNQLLIDTKNREIEYLNALLKEKERLIEVLMDKADR